MTGREFSDELIIKARREQEELEKARHSDEVVEKEIKQSIYDEIVHIFDIPVVFKEFDLLGGKAKMRMPEDFTERSEEEIASVYVLGSRPQYVFSNGYLNFMTALNWTKNLIADSNIFDFTKFARQAIERIGPKARILNVEKFRQGENSQAILEFIAQTIDSVNYNVMFFASLEGRLVIGSITFDQKYVKRLRPLTVEMAKSFRLSGEEETQA
ncbi:MAG: hypothetical protein ACI4D2_00760 [Lachnospiraceae bacterium]